MSSTQDLSHKAGELTGQAQIKKDEYVNKASNAVNEASHDSQSDQNNPSITSQASNFIQQTGVQVKSMAQGAAEAVKNTLGMNSDTNPASAGNTTATANHPTNPATGPTTAANPPSNNPATGTAAAANHPSNPSTETTTTTTAAANRPSNPGPLL